MKHEINLTDEEMFSLNEMEHLLKGGRLSTEGAKKWNNYSSDNQIQALINYDITELRSTKVYQRAERKLRNLNNVEFAVYDQVV